MRFLLVLGRSDDCLLLLTSLVFAAGLVEEMNLLAMPEEMAPYFPLFQQQLSHSVRMLLEEASFRSKCLIHCRLKAIETLRDQLLEEDSLSGSDVEKASGNQSNSLR